jgi:hypothetical protein
MMPLNLASKFFEVAARGERGDTEALGQRLHDGETLPPNRTR